MRFRLLLLIAALFCIGGTAGAQTSAFTYQGRLTDNLAAASGTYQMQFALFDAASAGTLVSALLDRSSVTVTNGVFTVELDFGPSPYTGDERYLQISVRRNSGESYVILTPRQRITSAPYSVRAAAAPGGSSGSAIAFTAGTATAPAGTTAFIAPTVTITKTSAQRVFVSSHAALGAGATPANSLNLYICYQGPVSITTIGGGLFGMTAAANQRHIFSLSAVTPAGLAGGTYNVGLCGASTSPNWVNNEWGYTTAFTVN